MGFLDNIGATLSQKSNEVAEKTKDSIDVMGLKNKINSLNKDIQAEYLKLGNLYYAAHKDNEEDEYKENLVKITSLFTDIDDCNQKIKAIEAKSAAAATSFCPNCGAQLEKGAAFCTECGSKIGG